MSNVKAVFAHLDCLVDGIYEVKKSGHADYLAVAPLPRHEIEELIYEGRPSPVRWFTMFGAILGGTIGFSLASLTHLNWPMIIPAGKPLVSVPAFLVITFESTVLWGCLFTLIGLLTMCRLPAWDLQVEATDPRFSDDCFGLVLNGLTPEKAAQWKAKLEALGAVDVVITEAADA
ncbi:MAG: DUF3341 domain-containing protein [Alphaproteobacteria bacterium]|nr:DUF3341 domain-containing protein [Alphaproteobacteria bacterium]